MKIYLSHSASLPASNKHPGRVHWFVVQPTPAGLFDDAMADEIKRLSAAGRTVVEVEVEPWQATESARERYDGIREMGRSNRQAPPGLLARLWGKLGPVW